MASQEDGAEANIAREIITIDDDGDEEFDLSDAEAYFDTAFASNDSSRLLQLPPELLLLIIEHGLLPLYDTPFKVPSNCVPFLRKMRLVHPIFAHSSWIQCQLFHTIHLMPDTDQLRALERGFGDVMPYVQRVLFYPMLLNRENLPHDRRSDSRRKISKNLEPRISRDINSGRVMKVWTGVLEACTKAQIFGIRKIDDVGHSVVNCGPSAHVLLNLTLEALVAAKRRPRGLELYHETEEEFVFTKILEWDHLDLSRLRSLQIEFQLRHDPVFYGSFGFESKAVCSVLMHNSVSTLSHLQLDGNLGWVHKLFESSPPAFTSLRTLEISRTQLEPARFGKWILGISCLREISIRNSYVTGTSEVDNWRPIFQALQEHPGNLLVKLEDLDLLCAAGPMGYLFLYHQIPQHPSSKEEGYHDVICEIIDMLKKYLSRLAKWTVEEHWGYDHYLAEIEDYDIASDWSYWRDETDYGDESGLGDLFDVDNDDTSSLDPE